MRKTSAFESLRLFHEKFRMEFATYGWNTWTLLNSFETYIGTAESYEYPGTSRVTNDEILNRVKENRTVLEMTNGTAGSHIGIPHCLRQSYKERAE